MCPQRPERLISSTLIKVLAFSILKLAKLLTTIKDMYSPAFRCYRKKGGIRHEKDLSSTGGFYLFFLSRTAVKADTGHSDCIPWHFERKTGTQTCFP